MGEGEGRGEERKEEGRRGEGRLGDLHCSE